MPRLKIRGSLITCHTLTGEVLLIRILGFLSLQAADCKLTEALTTLGLVDIQVNIHPNTENWLLHFFTCGNVMQGHEPGHMEWIVKYNTIFKLWYKLPDHPYLCTLS